MRPSSLSIGVVCLITWLGFLSVAGSQDARPGPPPSPGAPTLDEWLSRARPLNPDVSDADLRAYWERTYGGTQAQAATEGTGVQQNAQPGLRARDEENQAVARVIAQCVETVRQASSLRKYGVESDFDAYASGDKVRYFGTPAELFQFEKCMAQHGRPLK